MSEELKPCPFCGCKAEVESGKANITMSSGDVFVVKCTNIGCNAAIYFEFETEQEAISAWNHRPQPENPPLTLEELREMDGEPVFIIDGDEPLDRYWELSENAADYIDSRFAEDYGKTWLAYRYKLEDKSCK
jgi:Lar family restriction alleviation protein